MPPFSSTRWCPTPEQRMILKELYGRGLMTPNSSQVIKITTLLSSYGKINGKNVYYWFQNHKARDRQRLRKKLAIASQLHQPHQRSQHHNSNYSHEILHPMQGHAFILGWTAADRLMRTDGHAPAMISTFKRPGCENIRPLETLQLFPLASPSQKELPQQMTST